MQPDPDVATVPFAAALGSCRRTAPTRVLRLRLGDPQAAVADPDRALHQDPRLKGGFENTLGSARAMLGK